MEYNYKTLNLETMMKYIQDNAPQDKEWFKSVAVTEKEIQDKKTGKKKTRPVYNHFKAREEFCKKYMPDIIPVAKKKQPSKAEILANW